MILGPHKYNPPDAVIFRERRPDKKKVIYSEKYLPNFEDRVADIIRRELGTHPFHQRTYRGRNQVMARQLFLYFIADNTKKTFKEISALIGNTHTSVTYAQKKIYDLCDTDKKFKEIFDNIETKVKNLK
jgi:hypothetical protein